MGKFASFLKRIMVRLGLKRDVAGKRSLERKRRSERKLRAENVPINEYLPRIEDETETKIRTQGEVENRAIALCLVAQRGVGLPKQEMLKYMEDFGAEGWLSPDERKFVFDEKPSERQRIQFSWRYECFWVMVWALSFVDKLERPEQPCDPAVAVPILLNLGEKEFRKQARLRSSDELLNEADLIYRYHWAVRDANLKGEQAPSGLNMDVVTERHEALNWLVGYCDLPWDEVTTDT